MTGRPEDPIEPRDPASGEPTAQLETGDGLFARGRDLAGLSVAAIAMAALLCAWIVLALSRQVGEAADASNRARQLVAGNQALTTQIQTLNEELTLIQQQAYIEIQARAHGLGGRDEKPFSLAADAPSLAPDAPGSEAVALGASAARTSPLDGWLDLLFGPGH
jgi:cell division protein FtsB